MWGQGGGQGEEGVVTRNYRKLVMPLMTALEIVGTKVQICARKAKAAHCAHKAAHCTWVCHKTVRKNIDRAQLPAVLSKNYA